MTDKQMYDAAVAQVRKDPADVTDEQLETLRATNPQFADLAAEARARYRRGDAYQQKLVSAAYETDVRRRRLLQGLHNRPGDRSTNRDDVVSLEPPTKRTGVVVRIDPKVRR